jgi:hypothetical protein
MENEEQKVWKQRRGIAKETVFSSIKRMHMVNICICNKISEMIEEMISIESLYNLFRRMA